MDSEVSANSRLTVAAHALTWIGLYQRRGHEVATSEQIATSVNTNPVVIRRLLAELRKSEAVRGTLNTPKNSEDTSTEAPTGYRTV
ncbi:Transcriptional regulator [Actinopolyspora mzabensis]|uniref:Transcriptional regulator n=1 Tax=Actinopolyspora mzabensis TaxID=995066 RepID=A0A1G8Y1Z8_ACTMZ|nr:Transcriptional regulator [Actinopolyspora mzabensis]